MRFAQRRSVAREFRLYTCFGLLALACPPAAVAGPYVALVNGTEVKVRTGGSQNHFTFAAVRMGQRVIVNRDVNGWSKIHIPRWIPVYVHKNYVEVSGSKGRVKAGELNIRVVPDRAHEVVGNLAAGSEVEILAKEGDWLKITPPPSAFAYVSQRYLQKDREIQEGEVSRQLGLLTSAAEPQAVASRSKDAGTGGGHGKPAEAQGGGARGKSASGAAATDTGSGGGHGGRAGTLHATLDGTAVRRADDLAMRISAQEDILKRDYGPAKTIYQEVVKSSEDQAEIRAAEAGLRKIAEIEGNQATLAQAHRSVANVEKKNQEIDQRVRNARFSRPATRGADSDPYLARGWLSGFGLFSGHPGTHRLMKGSQVLYYLQSEEGKSISLDSYLNKRVGVKGVIRELEPRYGANLIVVSDISVLSDR